MGGGPVATRSARVGRVAPVLAVFAAVLAIGAAATPVDHPAEAAVLAAPAPAVPAPASTATPAADPLSAAASPAGDPLSAPASPAGDPPSAPATPAADPLSAPADSAGGEPSGPAGTEPVPLPAPAATPAAPAITLRSVGARAAAITDRTADWASFTLLDRRTGQRVGDARSAEVTNSESTVKAWLAADLLATRAAEGRRPTAYETTRMTSMIRVSDDDSAEVIWRWLGADASIRKMISVCRLTDTRVYRDWWSLTQISSRDLARLGSCITPGRKAFLSPAVGAPLVALMRSVAQSDAFGIQQVYPAGRGVRIAVKNGWTEHGGSGRWNVNCLGIWGPADRWVLAVTTRYPIADGLDFGAAVCRRVTGAVLPLTRL